MVVRTRKRTQKRRGTKTHGCGSMKKRRGAGNRGGRGRAGSGYRGDAKKPSVWKVYVGGKDPSKRGFNSRLSTLRTINIGHLSSIASTLVKNGEAMEGKDAIIVNLRELNIQKLLGAGKIGQRLKIGCAIATQKAVDKVVAVGGSVDADVIVDKEKVKADRKAAKIEASKKVVEEKPVEKKPEVPKKEKAPEVAEKPTPKRETLKPEVVEEKPIEEVVPEPVEEPVSKDKPSEKSE